MYFNSKNIFQERRENQIPRYKPTKKNSIEKAKKKKKDV